jgi:hypothetical protein
MTPVSTLNMVLRVVTWISNAEFQGLPPERLSQNLHCDKTTGTALPAYLGLDLGVELVNFGVSMDSSLQQIGACLSKVLTFTQWRTGLLLGHTFIIFWN